MKYCYYSLNVYKMCFCRKQWPFWLMQNGVARGGQGKILGGPYVTFFRCQSKSVFLEDHFWGGHWGGQPFIWGGHGHPRPPLRNAPGRKYQFMSLLLKVSDICYLIYIYIVV